MPPKTLSSDPAREWAKHALEEQERQRLEELGRLSREREHEVWLDPGRICMNEIDQLVAAHGVNLCRISRAPTASSASTSRRRACHTKERLQELFFEECCAFHPEQVEVEAARPHGYRIRNKY